MERCIMFACRHRFAVSFPYVMSEEAADDLVAFLSHILCVHCQHTQRYKMVVRLQQRLGFFPLVASDPRQQMLAEQVRAEVIRRCYPEDAFPCSQTMASLRALVHTRLDAAFWIARRAVLWDPSRLPDLLADLHAEGDGLLADRSRYPNHMLLLSVVRFV